MFNHQDAPGYVFENFGKVERYEQLCPKCKRWTQVPLEALMRAIEPLPPEPGKIGRPMIDCPCEHCGGTVWVKEPGKYDALNARRPTMQRIVWKARAKKPPAYAPMPEVTSTTKIELRRISYNARLSQETAAYAADIYVDGKLVGRVSNDGHGGADMVSPHEVHHKIEAYANTLPPTEEFGTKLPQTAETIFARLLDRHLLGKRLTGLLKRTTVIARGGKIYTAKGPVAQRPGDIILNSLPFEEALDKFIAGAA